MQPAETHYALSGDVSIAYQVIGDGPIDLVFVPGFVSNVEYAWEEPRLAAFYEALSEFCRLIVFDKRGTGLSDRVRGVPDLETRIEDVHAIMDAVGSKRAAVLGYSEGAAMAALYAATYPRRTIALVLYGSFFGTGGRKSLFGTGGPREAEQVEEVGRRWGTQAYCAELLREDAPSLSEDEAFARWYAARLRLSVSPAGAVALTKMSWDTDVRSVLPSIRVPAVVLHRTGDRACSVDAARAGAAAIPGAEFVELPGDDHLPWVGDSAALVSEIRRFLEETVRLRRWDDEPDRVVSTVLFTDIVDSTRQAVEVGDREWRRMLEAHHAVVRRQLVRFHGRELDTAGDGFFASFDGPARAIRCACEIVEAVRTAVGLTVRAGVHTGECETVDGKIGGIAVHIGARVAREAGPGEVLASSTVKDLVAGSGIAFEDRGIYDLKGVPGEWRLYAVSSVDE
ncbi:MAG: hypothetical protein QOE43_879 [Gaiellaceae bacterium]|jgi:pimeloyl-ACP methyl ester carboxylesterase/class 3 adenylate cyclase|nr:hypothetical protein [Gaiellaceae bacterium]